MHASVAAIEVVGIYRAGGSVNMASARGAERGGSICGEGVEDWYLARSGVERRRRRKRLVCRCRIAVWLRLCSFWVSVSFWFQRWVEVDV